MSETSRTEPTESNEPSVPGGSSPVTAMFVVLVSAGTVTTLLTAQVVWLVLGCLLGAAVAYVGQDVPENRTRDRDES